MNWIDDVVEADGKGKFVVETTEPTGLMNYLHRKYGSGVSCSFTSSDISERLPHEKVRIIVRLRFNQNIIGG